MPSRATEARSISDQLVLLFTLAAAVLLSSGFAILYWIAVQHALEEDDAVLIDKVFAVRAHLENTGGAGPLNQELNILPGRSHIPYWVRVVDATGLSVAETPGMNAILPPANFPSPEELAARNDSRLNYRSGGKLFALTSVRQTLGGERFIIQAAQDRSEDEEFRKKFGLVLGGVLACGIAASAVISRSVTRRGLRPLAELTRSFKRIGSEHLHERVPPAGWPRELRPLAHAFAEMLDRLENSFTRLSQFSADLAHELRTPIANLRGEAEVALTRSRTPEDYRAVIESSVAECERLSVIIDNLLFLARAEAADRLPERTRFDGRASLEKIAEFYETIAEERRIQITCAGEGEVLADPVLFGRAVSNLLDNALRFTPEGGRIEIGVVRRNAHSEISVADTGSGIAPEHLPRVFDRFYRGDSSRSSQGTGLGLALVRSICRLHGGDAAAQSAVGHGTTVRLAFPDHSPSLPA